MKKSYLKSLFLLTYKKFILFQLIIYGLILSSSFGLLAQPTTPRVFITIDPENSADSLEIVPGNNSFRICTGTTIRLSGFSTGNNLTYTWRNTLDAIVSSSSVLQEPLSEGSYRLEVRDENNLFAVSQEVELCVDIALPTNIFISSNGLVSVCDGSTADSTTIKLTANADFPLESFLPTCRSANDIENYTWYKNNFDNPISTEKVLEIPNAPSSIGIYFVEASNTCGSANVASFELIERVNSPPSNVRIFPSDPIVGVCEGDSLELRAEVPGDPLGIFFQWIEVGSNQIVGTGPTFTVDGSNANKQYFVQVLNGCGSAFSEPVSIFNIGLGSLNVFLSLSITSINRACQGDTIMLSTITSPLSLINSVDLIKDGVRVENFQGIIPPEIPITESGAYQVQVNRCGDTFLSGIAKVLFTIPPTTLEVRPEGPPTLAPACDPPTNSLRIRARSDGTRLIHRWEKSTDNINFIQVADSVPFIDITETGFYRVKAINECISDSIVSSSLEVIEVNSFAVDSSTIASVEDPTNCVNDIITLTTNDAGPGAIYIWSRDGLPVDSTLVPNLLVQTSGAYQVQASNACGVAAQSSSIAVSIGLAPTNLSVSSSNAVTSSSPFVICGLNEKASLNATVEGTDIQFEWLNEQGQVFATVPNIVVENPGIYIIRTSNACGITEDTIQVRFDLPPFEMELSLEIEDPCASTGQVRLITETSASNATFIWSRDGIRVDTTDVPFLDVMETGNYRVSVSNACDPIGISSELLRVFSLDGLPIPSITTFPEEGIDRICPGEQVILQAQIQTNPAGFQFRWFRGFEPLEGESNNTLVVNERGEYRVEVFSDDNLNCTGISLPYNVFVRPSPTVLLAFDGSLSLCEGDSVELRAGAGITPSSFFWFRDGEFISESSAIIAKEGGTYEIVALYDTNIPGFPCDTNISREVEVEVIEILRPEIVIEGNVLRAVDTSAAYQWNVDGIPIFGANEMTYLPLDSGFYSLTVTNEVGCSGISEAIFHPGTFQERDDIFRVAPNPSSGTFTVVVLSDSVSSITIYDAIGRLLFEEQNIPRANSISGFREVQVENLPPGMYLLRAFIDERFVTRKVVVL